MAERFATTPVLETTTGSARRSPVEQEAQDG